jgi:hypothetical protein
MPNTLPEVSASRRLELLGHQLRELEDRERDSLRASKTAGMQESVWSSVKQVSGPVDLHRPYVLFRT